jgi:hypothetical protein
VIPYTRSESIGVRGSGLKDKFCLGDSVVCSGSSDAGYAFLIATQDIGNVEFLEDGMVGLSPDPDTPNVLSFGEYMVQNKIIDKHLVSLTTKDITFGAHAQRDDLIWNDFTYDSDYKNWVFSTDEMRINDMTFLSNKTIVAIQNFVPGTYVWTTNPDLPSAFAAAAMKTSNNITC